MQTVYIGNTLINDVMLGSQRMDDVLTRQAIIEDGLIIYLNSMTSYPGTGTTWYNLASASPATASLQPDVTYVNGYLQVSSSATGYIDVCDLNYTSSNYTVMTATRYITASGTIGKDRMLAGKNNNWLLGNWRATTENYFCENTVYGIPGGANDANWRIYTGTSNYSADNWKFYVNNVKLADSNAGIAGFNGLRIGVQNGGGETSNGQVAFVLVYNRVLSESEMTQNYNTLKGMVGL